MKYLNPYTPPGAQPDQPGSVVLSAPYTVRYELSGADLIRFAEHANGRSQVLQGRAKKSRIRLLLLGVVFALLAAAYPGATGFTAAFFPLMSLYMMAVALLMPWMRRRSVKSINKMILSETNKRVAFAPTKLSIAMDTVRVSSDAEQREIRWWAVQEVAYTKEAAYIYLSAFSALIVPARAFSDQRAFAGFGELARELWRAGQARAPGAAGD